MTNENAMYAVEVDEDMFDEAVVEGLGWCPACEAFTTGVLDEHATACRCMDCGDTRVSGAVHAAQAGFITVEVL
jgi:hypothetical protein